MSAMKQVWTRLSPEDFMELLYIQQRLGHETLGALVREILLDAIDRHDVSEVSEVSDGNP